MTEEELRIKAEKYCYGVWGKFWKSQMIVLTPKEITDVMADFVEELMKKEQPPASTITDKEYKDLMKVLYPKDNSKRYRP